MSNKIFILWILAIVMWTSGKALLSLFKMRQEEKKKIFYKNANDLIYKYQIIRIVKDAIYTSSNFSYYEHLLKADTELNKIKKESDIWFSRLTYDLICSYVDENIEIWEDAELEWFKL